MIAGHPELAPSSLHSWLHQRQQNWVDLLEELVTLESPSGDQERLRACTEVASDRIRQLLDPDQIEVMSVSGVPQLRVRLTGAGGPGVLLLAHLDTVWELGAYQPLFAINAGRAQGPGVFDMKGGLVVGLAALAALREIDDRAPSVTLLCTGDEEVGSAASRDLIETEAKQAAAVLVLEPPAGLEVKVARKGVGTYTIQIDGRAAHAGLEPERGVNSVVELAALVGKVSELSRRELGTTVTPTVFQGGQRVNVIPAAAELRVDVRFGSQAEAARVDLAIRALRPADPEARITVLGGSNRPPLEASASAALFALAAAVAERLGLQPLRGTSVGGGSDGNFTAALSVPTLDGLGIVGGNAHAAGEWADLASIPTRAALLAGCIDAVSRGELQ